MDNFLTNHQYFEDLFYQQLFHNLCKNNMYNLNCMFDLLQPILFYIFLVLAYPTSFCGSIASIISAINSSTYSESLVAQTYAVCSSLNLIGKSFVGTSIT